MRLTHKDLMSIGFKLGYPLDGDGLCFGFAMMLTQAWLCNDEATFFERFNFIETYNNDFDQLKADILAAQQHAKTQSFRALDENTKILLEIPAFFEGVTLYLRPRYHSDIFNTYTRQEQMTSIYPLVRSHQLEGEDLSIAFNKPYIFNTVTILSFLEDFETLFQSSGISAPMVLLSINHAVNLRYKIESQIWEYVDTNSFSTYRYVRKFDSLSLAVDIFKSFGCKKWVGFSTVVLSKSSLVTTFTDKLSDLAKKYPITEEQAFAHDDHHTGLLFLATMQGNLALVLELLKYKNIPVNQSVINGFTPLMIACQKGYSDIAAALLRYPGIQVNQENLAGVSPLFMACGSGHVEVVRELLKHDDIKINQAKNASFLPVSPSRSLSAESRSEETTLYPAGKQRGAGIGKVPDKLPKNSGYTPLMIACEKGYLAIVHELLQHQGIHVNQPTPSGKTAMSIAVTLGHRPIIDALEQAQARQGDISRKAKESIVQSIVFKFKGLLSRDHIARLDKQVIDLINQKWASLISLHTAANIPVEDLLALDLPVQCLIYDHWIAIERLIDSAGVCFKDIAVMELSAQRLVYDHWSSVYFLVKIAEIPYVDLFGLEQADQRILYDHYIRASILKMNDNLSLGDLVDTIKKEIRIENGGAQTSFEGKCSGTVPLATGRVDTFEDSNSASSAKGFNAH